MRDHAGRIIKTKSWRRHHRGATMRGKPCRGIAEEKPLDETSWKRRHGGEIIEEPSWKRYHGGEIRRTKHGRQIRQEGSWRIRLGREIMEETSKRRNVEEKS